MKTKNKLNCYLFSNLIVSFLSLNFLVNDNYKNLLAVTNNNVLNKIYEIEETGVQTISNNNVTTISVSMKNVQSKNTISYIKPSYNSVTGTNLVNYAKHYLGLPYVSGGYSLTSGTDCSGFTKLIYQEFGIGIGRTVRSQLYSGTYVDKSDLRPGDLVFYGYTNYATHVGIYIGDGLVIHESNPRDGVKINSVNMMVYITARRLITVDVVSEEETEVQEEIKTPVSSLENDTFKSDEEIGDNSKDDTLNSDNNLNIEKENDLTNEEISNSEAILPSDDVLEDNSEEITNNSSTDLAGKENINENEMVDNLEEVATTQEESSPDLSNETINPTIEETTEEI